MPHKLAAVVLTYWGYLEQHGKEIEDIEMGKPWAQDFWQDDQERRERKAEGEA